MSSPYVRDRILPEITALVAPIPVVDLTGYTSLDELGDNADVNNRVVLVDFIVADDSFADIGGEGNQGWRERGTVQVHWMVPKGFEHGPDLTNAESFRQSLRGRRLDDVTIEAMSPFTDAASPIEDSGWTSFISMLSYLYNTCG